MIRSWYRKVWNLWRESVTSSIVSTISQTRRNFGRLLGNGTVAVECGIFDGEHLDILVHVEQSSRGRSRNTLVLKSVSGGSRGHKISIPLVEARDKYQAKINIGSLGLNVPTSSVWDMWLRVDSRLFYLNPVVHGLAPSPIKSPPLSPTTGSSFSLKSGTRGTLRLRIGAPRSVAHVDEVVLGPGLFRISGRLVPPEPTESPSLALLLRGEEITLSAQPTICRESDYVGKEANVCHFVWDVPTDEMQKLLSSRGKVNEVTWDLAAQTDRGTVPLTKRLSDLSNPRDIFKYKTVASISAFSLSTFRPYWTQVGTLAIHQRCRTLPRDA